MTTEIRATPFRPILIRDVELTAPVPPPEDARGYAAVRAAIRLRGVPVGEVSLPLAGRFDEGPVRRAAIDRLTWPVVRRYVRDIVGTTARRPRSAEELFDLAYADADGSVGALPTHEESVVSQLLSP